MAMATEKETIAGQDHFIEGVGGWWEREGGEELCDEGCGDQAERLSSSCCGFSCVRI